MCPSLLSFLMKHLPVPTFIILTVRISKSKSVPKTEFKELISPAAGRVLRKLSPPAAGRGVRSGVWAGWSPGLGPGHHAEKSIPRADELFSNVALN